LTWDHRFRIQFARQPPRPLGRRVFRITGSLTDRISANSQVIPPAAIDGDLLNTCAVRDASREELRPTPRLGMSRGMPLERLDNILQLYVSLEEIEPRIWRRIQVPDSFTLKQLHRVIQIVMGWQDGHLHEFILSGKRYGEPNPEDEETVIDDRTVRLRDLPLSIGASIGYAYDFGDNWQHQLLLEKTLPPAPETIYPACIAGERSTPPEDVGGAGGYAELLEAIADPDHEDHDANLEWLGGQFDPEAFSIAEVNKRLRRRLRRSRKR